MNKIQSLTASMQVESQVMFFFLQNIPEASNQTSIVIFEIWKKNINHKIDVELVWYRPRLR